MKYLVVSVLCFFGAVQAGLITEEQKAKLMEIHTECMKESGVDEAIALKAREGDYVDDPKLKKQLFCFNKKVGFQNEAGDLQVDFIKTKLVDIIKDEKIAEGFINKCNIKKENGEETAFASLKCFHELAPNKNVFE